MRRYRKGGVGSGQKTGTFFRKYLSRPRVGSRLFKAVKDGSGNNGGGAEEDELGYLGRAYTW